MSIEDIGELELEAANDANVPVNIFIEREEDDQGEKTGKWILTADCFMPRKCVAADSAFKVEADSLEELQAVIRKHILPLYEVALANINDMLSATGAEADLPSHYYWSPND
jgi:hypothetical protein